MSDSFHLKDHGKYFKLSSNNSMITKTKQGHGTAHCSRIVDAGIHKWQFKFVKYASESDAGSIQIGIWRTDRKIQNDKRLSHSKSYAFQITHGELTFGEGREGTNWNQKYANKYCKEGDVIIMILDLDALELRYNVNGKDLGLAFKVKKGSYRAAVSIWGKNDVIQLVSYKMKISDNNNNNNNVDDIKCTECDKLQETINMKENINKELVNEIALLTGAYKDAQQQIKKIKHEKTEIQQKFNEVNQVNIKLNEECKELQTDLSEMKEKYDKLYRKMNVDESNYLNWDSDMIADWMINLDGEYEEYEQILRVNLKEEQIDGSLLGELDKNDLHRLGIKPLKHKKTILEYIKKLTTKQVHDQFSQNNEGNNATLYI